MTTAINPFERLAPDDGSANIHHFIDGRLRIGSSQRYSDVFNPARGQLSGRVAFATKTEIDEAILAASKAFSAWSRMPAVQRSRMSGRRHYLRHRSAPSMERYWTMPEAKWCEDWKSLSLLAGLHSY